MEIGIGLWAFLVYLAVIIFWIALFKRPGAEAMMIGLLAVCLFCGPSDYLPELWSSMVRTSVIDVRLAAMLFTLMAVVMQQTGIINRLINILNSLLGRIKGGPAYISILASALFGMISGSGTGNSASVGSITIPWLKETGWPSEVAATMNSGNAGLGIAIPPSSTLFLMFGFAEVSAYVALDDVYISLIIAGAWSVLYRIILVYFYVRKYKVDALPQDKILTFKTAMVEGGSSLLMFMGILIPMALTMGPVSEWLVATDFGAKGVNSINIIIWVPVLIILISIIEGHRYLPRDMSGWAKMAVRAMKLFATASATMFFAVSGSYVLRDLGFGDALLKVLDNLTLPMIPLVIITGAMIIVMAGPLSSTATTTMLGPVGFLAMVNVGVRPELALAAYMCFISTEGATPPSSTPMFISAGIAECDVVATYKPLLFHYVIPTLIIGTLIAIGILPIFA